MWDWYVVGRITGGMIWPSFRTSMAAKVSPGRSFLSGWTNWEKRHGVFWEESLNFVWKVTVWVLSFYICHFFIYYCNWKVNFRFEWDPGANCAWRFLDSDHFWGWTLFCIFAWPRSTGTVTLILSSMAPLRSPRYCTWTVKMRPGWLHGTWELDGWLKEREREGTCMARINDLLWGCQPWRS